jgi:uncharacterized protein (DUF433 family)
MPEVSRHWTGTPLTPSPRSSPEPPGSSEPARPGRALRAHAGGNDFAQASSTGQTGFVTAEQLEMISSDPQVMHGQAVIAGTRVPVSVILDCLAAGMTADQIAAEYPSVTPAGVRAAAAYGAALAREELLPIPQTR